jgi:hypothetical protein
MEIWEKRLKHEKDVLNTYCIMNKIPLPEHPKNAIIIPKEKFRKFDGKFFFNEMKKLGHNAIDFNSCNCKSNCSDKQS